MELRVLVIDDDEIFNLMADVMLRDLGISAHPQCFTSGQEALTYINREASSAVTYLIFLDINMPTMSGWEVLDYLAALPNHHRVHVVVVTSSIDRADKQKALTYTHVIDYMVKPLKKEALSTLKHQEKLAPFFPH